MNKSREFVDEIGKATDIINNAIAKYGLEDPKKNMCPVFVEGKFFFVLNDEEFKLITTCRKYHLFSIIFSSYRTVGVQYVCLF